MEYEVRLHPRVQWRIARWGLSDYLFVELHLTLCELLGTNPAEVLLRDEGGDGSFFSFMRTDPASPFFRHLFHFRVYFDEAETHLNVVDVTYDRVFVPGSSNDRR